MSISTVFLRVLADVLSQRGLSAHQIPKLANLTASAARADWPTFAEFSLVFSQVVQLTAEPALGLVSGSEAIDPSFSLLGSLVAHAPTLRQAIALAAQFHPLVMDGAAMHFSEHAGRARLTGEFPRVDPLLDRGLAELAVAGFWRMLRAYGATTDALFAVLFEHRAPHYQETYTRVFLRTVSFDAEFTGIEFDSALLDRPHVHFEPELHALLQAQAERSIVQGVRSTSFVERVQRLLARQHGKPDMQRAARDLGLSVRSLRRRLEEEGSTYREVTQLALQEAACRLLCNPEWTPQAVAHALGFARDTAFHRAFKRWTGLTVAQYRERAWAGPQ